MNREKFMDYVAEYLGVEKYEEFEMFSSRYRVTDENIEVYHNAQWVRSGNGFNFFKKENVVKLPWKPKLGEKYWYIEITDEDGVDNFYYHNDQIDKRVIERGEIFKTEKQALERVKELGW